MNPENIQKLVEQGELVHFIVQDPDDADVFYDFGCTGRISTARREKVTCPMCLKILRSLFS